MSDAKRRYTASLIRNLIANDRELDAQASKGWRHTHETIVRENDRKIVANMFTFRAPRSPRDLLNQVAGAPQSYNGWETDPAYELKDARFIVHARTALPRRVEIIEQLMADRAELRAALDDLRGMIDFEASDYLQERSKEIEALLDRNKD